MLLDSRGNTISSKKFLNGARQGYNLPWQSPAVKDINELISTSDWRTVVSASRTLYGNVGTVKGAIEAKAMYSVGNAWKPSFGGKDQEWGDMATEWLVNWYKVCDVKGSVFDFKTSLYLDSVAIDRDGDVFTLFTKSKTGFPLLQTIPGDRIGCRNNEEVVESGRYAGLRIVNGVILNKVGRAVAYRILGDDETKDYDISARYLRQTFEPSWYDLPRGLPLFSHAIQEFRSMAESNEREQYAQLLVSSLALIEHNADGLPDPSNPDTLYGTADSNGRSVGSTTFDGGQIRIFDAASKSRIEQIKHDRPGPNFESYHQRLVDICLAGVHWPKSLLLEKEGNGVANRVALAQADKSVNDRQSLLEPLALAKVQYALSMAIERGDLPKNEEWYKWSFTKPKRVSVDIFRESEQRRKDYEIGHKTLSDIAAEEGKTVDELLRQKWQDRARDMQIKEEVEKATGVTFDNEEQE